MGSNANPKLAQLPSSNQYVRKDLRAGTFNDLDVFRYRVSTNSVRYDYDIYVNNSKTATYKVSLRVDLAVGSAASKGHNGILFPHAQISFITRIDKNMNVAPALNAYLLQDTDNNNEVREVINQASCPNGVQLWIYSELQALSEFTGKSIFLKPTKNRYVASGDKNPQTALIPDDIMKVDWELKKSKGMKFPPWS